MHQAEYQVEEHMYRVFMERGEDSPDYQELVQLREDAASRHQISNSVGLLVSPPLCAVDKEICVCVAISLTRSLLFVEQGEN